MKIYLVYISDVWQSYSSMELQGAYTNQNKAEAHYTKLCKQSNQHNDVVLYTANGNGLNEKLKSKSGN